MTETAHTRVLVADDDVDAASALAMLLEAVGYETRTAYNGSSALELARRWHPEAIFLDVSMPLLNGDEVCRRVREEPWGRGVLIAAVTGLGKPEDKRRSRAAGFDRHLVKPVDPKVILDLLQSL